jgi:colanic acid/amylovoran biosynthesis glycosyltransferase
VRIAYLINQYPKVSHSFIRREILSLESQGLEIARFAIRSCSGELVDEQDKREFQKTRVVLQQGLSVWISSIIWTFATRPLRLVSALRLAIQIGWRSERGLPIHLIYLAESCILLRWFQSLGIAHAHAHFGTNSTTVLMLCLRLGGPTYSFTVHGPEEFDKPSAIALREKIQQAKFVIAISLFTRSQLYRWCEYNDWKKIHVIHCGVDESFLAQHITPVPESSTFICVGRLCEQKGQLLLLEAVKLLKQKNTDFKLLLVGDGPLRQEIEALVNAYQLDSQVEMIGWVSSDSIKNYILASKFLVLPSFAEGLPVVLMEALAMGRPFISTTVAGIPELMENHEGWLIPSGSVEHLVQAICTALNTDTSTLNSMGKIGKTNILKNFNISIETQKLLKLFM